MWVKKLGCFTIGLLGNDGGKLKNSVDLPVVIPSGNTPRVQECHILLLHIICEMVEEGLFSE